MKMIRNLGCVAFLCFFALSTCYVQIACAEPSAYLKAKRAKEAAQKERTRRSSLSDERLFSEFLEGLYAYENKVVFRVDVMRGKVMQVISETSALVMLDDSLDILRLDDIGGGVKLHQDLAISLPAIKTGTWQYVTVLGANSTVARYRVPRMLREDDLVDAQRNRNHLVEIVNRDFPLSD